MPMFDYKCQSCGHQFEKIVSLKDTDNPVACTKCGGETNKLFTTSVGLQFKGKWFTNNQSY